MTDYFQTSSLRMNAEQRKNMRQMLSKEISSKSNPNYTEYFTNKIYSEGY